ncbi:MAG: hypothetical protein V1876_00745 [Candidatus Peregrinibacteria bacterium]
MTEDTHEPIPKGSGRIERVRSPVSYLTEERFHSFRGQLVALLLDGSDKGTVIAHAPLDFVDPLKPRSAIHEQVAASAHKGRRYQVRQIPDLSVTEKQ